MCDILDDQNDFESFYLTSELVDYLSGNLIRMVNFTFFFRFLFKLIFRKNRWTDISIFLRNRHFTPIYQKT